MRRWLTEPLCEGKLNWSDMIIMMIEKAFIHNSNKQEWLKNVLIDLFPYYFSQYYITVAPHKSTALVSEALIFVFMTVRSYISVVCFSHLLLFFVLLCMSLLVLNVHKLLFFYLMLIIIISP